MRKGSRTKLTKTLQDRILNLIRVGNYNKVACQACGIHVDTYHEWKNRGEKDRAEGRITIYSAFSEALDVANAEAEIRMVTIISRGADLNSADAKWWLERKHHKDWGRKDKIEFDPEGGLPIIIKVPDKLTPKFKK